LVGGGGEWGAPARRERVSSTHAAGNVTAPNQGGSKREFQVKIYRTVVFPRVEMAWRGDTIRT